MTDIISVNNLNNQYSPAFAKKKSQKVAVKTDVADTFQTSKKTSAAGNVAALGATTGVVFSAAKVPDTAKKVCADLKGKNVPTKLKVAGIVTGSVLATAVYAFAGTGLGAVCGGIADSINNCKKENPVADTEAVSAEVSEEQASERPALIDGDFEPENNDETNEADYDINSEGG